MRTECGSLAGATCRDNLKSVIWYFYRSSLIYTIAGTVDNCSAAQQIISEKLRQAFEKDMTTLIHKVQYPTPEYPSHNQGPVDTSLFSFIKTVTSLYYFMRH